MNSHFPPFTYLYLYGTFACDLSLSRLSFLLFERLDKSNSAVLGCTYSWGEDGNGIHNTRAIHAGWIRHWNVC